MKSILSYSLLAAAMAAGVATAQTTATTGPVGYITLGNQGSATAVPANTDVVVSSPLLRSAEFAGLVASVSGNTIEVSGAQGWTSTQWTSDASKPYLLYSASGAQEGLSAIITGSSGSSLTVTVVDGTLSGLAAGDKLKIIPAWTVKSFISPASVPPGTQLFAYAGTAAGINVSPTHIMASTGTTWVFTLGGTGTADNFIVYPTESLVLRTGANPVTNLVLSGEVPTFKHRTTLSKLSAAGTAQDIRIAYTSPVNQPLLASGLGNAAGDQLFIYDNAVTGRNKAPSQIMTFTGSAWVGTFGPLTGNQNTYELVGGRGYVYRAAASTPQGIREWSSSQAYLPSL
ncbi:TIGR02597 family protein [Luteolibacter sp. SL250]|uniref:TIGR02597 family protein n=1 Tax=Luteolibacter sp. SL250 TaxID=2995170 RepID=UPI00226EEEF3|nr:TIGR02597 family protein [Luteolibacter sp. SL250]WAC20588.1 TIGR02597 family protein [Luteolibacter sp. SL250]